MMKRPRPIGLAWVSLAMCVGAISTGGGVAAAPPEGTHREYRGGGVCALAVPEVVRLLGSSGETDWADHQARLLAACQAARGARLGDPDGDPDGEVGGETGTHRYFDLSAMTGRDRLSMPREVAKIRAWSRRASVPIRGDLPFALANHQSQLAEARNARDGAETMDHAGAVISMALQVCLPFSTVRPRAPLLASTLRLDDGTGSALGSCCRTVQARIEMELLRRNWERVQFEVRPYLGRLRSSIAIDQAIMHELGLAHVSLRGLLQVERAVLHELHIKTPQQFGNEQERYFERMGARCLPVVVSRLEAGVVLAARLIHDAGSKVRNGETNAAKGWAPDQVRADDGDGRSGDEGACASLVGSAHSSVVHCSSCRHVKRIVPENLVHFSSLDEAIRAGRKPCRVCGAQ